MCGGGVRVRVSGCACARALPLLLTNMRYPQTMLPFSSEWSFSMRAMATIKFLEALVSRYYETYPPAYSPSTDDKVQLRGYCIMR